MFFNKVLLTLPEFLLRDPLVASDIGAEAFDACPIKLRPPETIALRQCICVFAPRPVEPELCRYLLEN